jgi:outer membrane protein insertion porin family
MIKAKFLACLLIAACAWSGGIDIVVANEAYAQSGPVVRQIRVVGNKRIAPETVKSYLNFNEGEHYDAGRADDGLKALVATGLFEDVKISQNGGVVTVTIVENAVINQVAFEGNKDVKSETLAVEVQAKPGAVFSRSGAQSDVQRILDVYRRSGYYAVQVDAQIIQLDHGRVNLVFAIHEGPETKVLNITFIGNKAFSDSQLRSVITTTQHNFLSFLKSTDVYDADRLNLDRELLRRYYLKNGYADARVVSAVANLDREGKGFYITFTVDEGEMYHFGKVDVESTLPSVDPASVRADMLTDSGELYNAEDVDKSTEKLTVAVAEQGYAFGQVRPRIDRDPNNRTIGVVYVIEQGPRVYIERINVVGNGRTRDYVIRRELHLAEGDAYNRLLAEQARQRLQNLGFFKSVKLNREAGSTADRVILTFVVEEQPTGELSIAGGYSSAEGPIAEVSYTERNLMGKGQFLRVKVSGSLEQSRQAELSFTEPRFLDKNISAGFDIFTKQVDYTTQSGYKDQKTGATLRVGFALTDKVWFQPNYTFVHDEVFDVQDDASTPIKQLGSYNDGVANISSVGYTLSYDTRNNHMNPNRGFYIALNQDVAGVGGDVNYVRSVVEGRAYYPVYEGITLVGRVIGGHIEGWDDQNVRLVDDFYKGGETIRGFGTAGVGARIRANDGTDNAVGGKNFYAGTVEMRFPFPFLPDELGFSGAVFADAGSVWETDLDPTLLDATKGEHILDGNTLRSSVGASLLWNSPVGPLRADFAYVLSKADWDDTQWFRFGATTKF